MPVRTWTAPKLATSLSQNTGADPELAVLADGRFVIVWEDFSGIGQNMARVFETDGTASAPEFVIPSGANPNDTALDPHVAALSDGGYAVVHGVSTTTGREVSIAQVFDSDSQSVQALGIFSDSPFTDFYDIHSVGDSFWMGVARDIGTDPLNAHIATFRNPSAGFIFKSTFQANITTPGNQDQVDIAELADGNVVVAWRDGNDVEFRLFQSDGAPISVADITVATTGSGDSSPEVMALANGGFLITYATLGGSFPASGYDVRGQIFAPDGTAYGSEFLLNTNTQGSQYNAVTTPLADGGFAAFWYTHDSGADRAILGQLFDGLGGRRGGEFTVATNDIFGIEDSLDVDTMPDGRIVLTWPTPTNDIEYAIVDPRDGVVEGTQGNDVALLGSRLDDEIRGFAGDDAMYGMDGSDYLLGGTGDDTLSGGAGADTLIGGAGEVDVASYADSGEALIFNLTTRTYSGGEADGDVLVGIDGAIGTAFDDLMTGRGGINAFYGEAGNDTIDGGATGDYLDGGAGRDSLIGGTGDDTLEGGGQGDTLSGGLQNDLLDGGDGNDRLEGGSQNDTLLGGNQNDLLDGGDGDDFLEGGSQNDTLLGGNNNDTLLGQDGNDELYGGGQNDALFGGNQNDLLDGGNGNDYLEGGGQNDTLLGGNNNDMLFGNTGNDELRGGGQVDELYGGSNNDTLYGDAGNDLLFGDGQMDFLYGGADSDMLDGGLGNDLLDGGTGNDTLEGGGQADTFVFKAGYGQDRIIDFQDDLDVIELITFGFADTAAAFAGGTQVGADYLFDFGNGDSLLIDNATEAQLTSDLDLGLGP